MKLEYRQTPPKTQICRLPVIRPRRYLRFPKLRNYSMFGSEVLQYSTTKHAFVDLNGEQGLRSCTPCIEHSLRDHIFNPLKFETIM